VGASLGDVGWSGGVIWSVWGNSFSLRRIDDEIIEEKIQKRDGKIYLF
jgi:hypothetical protein